MQRLQMLPSFAGNCSRQIGNRYTEFGSSPLKVSAFPFSISESENNLVVQFCLVIASASHPFLGSCVRGISSFFNRVSLIVAIRSKEVMVRVNASRIVAMVAHHKAVRYLAEALFKDKSMAAPKFSVLPHLTVAIGVYPSNPYPTRSNVRSMSWRRTVLVYSFPEPLPKSFVESLNTNASSPDAYFPASHATIIQDITL